jgi:hypothetical protein
MISMEGCIFLMIKIFEDTILKEAHRAVYCAHPGVREDVCEYQETLLLGRHEA